ncbi:hypothetical protein JQ627_17985 [Bradyrhizobium liaoningense]|nr:hypothetical protein [Bradyrhizobium liaoningense]MBR0819823.1 hypothetical protein [Bradyrhizobium liaoningense]
MNVLEAAIRDRGLDRNAEDGLGATVHGGVGRDTTAEDILVAAGLDRRAVGRAADLDVLIARDHGVRGQTEHKLRGAPQQPPFHWPSPRVPNEKRGAEGAAFADELERMKRQLAAAVVTVSRWRFMTILLSAPR